MIRTLVIDDELPAIERLKKLLLPFKDFDVVGQAQDGLTALEIVELKKPDLLFLDIEMPVLNGLEVAKTLGIHGPLIVFVTAYDEHALAAFDACAIDYIVKPINSDRLVLTIEKIRKSVFRENASLMNSLNTTLRDKAMLAGSAATPARLAVKVGSKFEVFDPTTISVAIAKDHYSCLVIEGRELLSDDSLEILVSRLDPADFVRVHRGAVINIKYLKELRRDGDRKFTAILADKSQTQVPVSRERLPQLKKILGLD